MSDRESASGAPRPIRIGVVDSGINPSHRHVKGVAGGVGIRVRDGELTTDDAWQDQIGHGTAVAATIRAHAPSAELYSIRIFRRRLAAHLEALVYAIEWAVAHELDVINCSLGYEGNREDKQAELANACRRARQAGAYTVAAAPEPPLTSPALSRDVLHVAADPHLEESELRFDERLVYASPWARHLGELPKERNVHGASLAVAHVSGILAGRLSNGRLARASGSLSLLESLRSGGG